MSFTNNNVRQPMKRRQFRLSRRRWSFSEEVAILKYIRDGKERGYEFESPTASIYYARLIKTVGLLNVDFDQIRNKTKNMKTKFCEALKWQNETGQGVDDGSIQAHLRKICPHYKDLYECFGDRSSFVLPYMFDNLEEDENDPVLQNIGNIYAGVSNNEERDIRDYDEQLSFAITEEINAATVADPISDMNNMSVVQPDCAAQISNCNIDQSLLHNLVNRLTTVHPSSSSTGNRTTLDTSDLVNRPTTVHPSSSSTGNRTTLDTSDLVNRPTTAHPSSSSTGNRTTLHTSDLVNRPTAVNPSSSSAVNRTTLSVNTGPSTSNVQRRLFTNRLPTSQPIRSTIVSQQDEVDEPDEQREIPRETITRFRTPLAAMPQSSNGFRPRVDREASNAASVIGEALTQRADAIKEKTKIESELKKEELRIAQERLNFEKQMREEELKLRQAELVSKEKVQILTIEKEERLAELRIRLQFDKENAR